MDLGRKVVLTRADVLSPAGAVTPRQAGPQHSRPGQAAQASALPGSSSGDPIGGRTPAAGQASHEVLLMAAANVPFEHGLQAVAPAPSEDVPRGHGLQGGHAPPGGPAAP